MKFDCQFVTNKDGLVAVIIKNKNNNNGQVVIQSGSNFEKKVDMQNTIEYHSAFYNLPIRVQEIPEDNRTNYNAKNLKKI